MAFRLKLRSGFSKGAKAAGSAITYLLRAALNVSNAQPLTTLDGTVTQVATGSVIIPDSTGTLITIAANNPAIPNAAYSAGDWSAPDAGETATILDSGLTRYTGGPSGNPALGVLCEPSATNVELYSEDFSSQSLGATTGAIVTNTAETTDPKGTNFADILVDNGATGTGSTVYVGSQLQYSANVNNTISVFAKAKGSDFVYINCSGFTTSGYAFFNLATGTVGTVVGTGYSASIKSYGNGWYRCSVTFNPGADALGVSRVGACDANASFNATLDGNTSIYLFGKQSETGSVPTTYIPTTTASVTRPARYKTVPGAELGSKIRFDLTSFEASGREWHLLNDGTRKLYHDGANLIFTDGTTTITAAQAIVAGTQYAIGLDTTAGAWALYVDGSAIDTDTGDAVAWGETVAIGATSAGASVLNGVITVLQSSNDIDASETT